MDATMELDSRHHQQRHDLDAPDMVTTTGEATADGETRQRGNSALDRLSSMAASARSNLIDADAAGGALPYKCGMVFFYHIPCTGGTTINEGLLIDQSTQRNGSALYFTHYGTRERTVEEKDHMEGLFIEGMNKHVQNISSDEWRISHAHTTSLHLNKSEGVLSSWRSEVESQGCKFIASVVFRDPLSHSLALAKHSDFVPREEWVGHLEARDTLSPPNMPAQIDFFLYNTVVRNPHNLTTAAKVERALEILVRHFDVVSVGEHGHFAKRLCSITGWKCKELSRLNSGPSEGRLVFSKHDIEKLQRLLRVNGDIDFIERVKLIYGNSGDVDS